MEIGGWSDSQTMHNIYTHIAGYDISERAKQMTAFYEDEADNSLLGQLAAKDKEIIELKRQLDELQKRYDILSDVSNQFSEMFKNMMKS